MKQRLDRVLVERHLASTRNQAAVLIRLGKVKVNGALSQKTGIMVSAEDDVHVKTDERYVSRAGLKLASVAEALQLEFAGKTMLDVGSSTGGFTDFALQHGTKKVIAVDVGTEQLHPSLRGNPNIELHEKTDIRSVYFAVNIANMASKPSKTASRRESVEHASADSRVADVSDSLTPCSSTVVLKNLPDIIVIDVSFISLRDILPHIATLAAPTTQIIAMVKPQFEAGKSQVNKGVIKNDSVRRAILKDFEQWSKQYFVISDKKDSDVAGSKGNRERFYVLRRT